MTAIFAPLRQYVAAHDPRVRAANVVAMVLAWNTPFYPLYLLGASGHATWLTACVFPVFLAVPAVTRRHPFAGRILLVLAGTINTLFCTWLLGEGSGTQLFLLPCITLAGLLFWRAEQGALFVFLVVPVVAGVALDGHYPISPFVCLGHECTGVVWLNAFSVALLTAFLGVLATDLAEPAAGPSTHR